MYLQVVANTNIKLFVLFKCFYSTVQQDLIFETKSKFETTKQDRAQEEFTESLIEILPGATFVACIYDHKWWLGLVKQFSEEHGNYLVSFMNPSGEAKQYFWREKEDSCWVKKTSIKCNIQSPAITSSSSTRGYSFLQSDLEQVKKSFPAHYGEQMRYVSWWKVIKCNFLELTLLTNETVWDQYILL